MNKPHQIPEELIRFKAHKLWEERLQKQRNETAESDWISAKNYLEKHRMEVFLWKLGKRLQLMGVRLMGEKTSPKKLPQKTDNIDNKASNERYDFPIWLTFPTIVVFMFLFLGIPGIIGYRMYWNSPVHPSFALFGVVAFSAVVAFTIVLTFEFVTGKDISFEFASTKFTGTSGPVSLWTLVFLSIMATFIFAGVKDLIQSDVESLELPTHLIHTKWSIRSCQQPDLNN